MKKVLILGGSGFVGRHVCEKLVEQNISATVLTRRRSNARHLFLLPMIEVLETQRLDAATLAAQLVGHDAVINLIAILHGNSQAFEKAHVELPKTIVSAC